MSQIALGGPSVGVDPLVLPTALTGGISPFLPAARHCSSRPAAAGEFLARASRARSQMARGGPAGVSVLVFPPPLTGAGPCHTVGASQMRPIASSDAP